MCARASSGNGGEAIDLPEYSQVQADHLLGGVVGGGDDVAFDGVLSAAMSPPLPGRLSEDALPVSCEYCGLVGGVTTEVISGHTLVLDEWTIRFNKVRSMLITRVGRGIDIT
jgi:hypothetical protein